jgi:hypothetical protein
MSVESKSMNAKTFENMIGLTMKSVVGDRGNDVMTFTSECGKVFTFYHGQDCCESVSIEDICGDLSNVDDVPEVSAESYTWTFYRFVSLKGSVTVRWLGMSNGYYSEGVSYSESKVGE